MRKVNVTEMQQHMPNNKKDFQIENVKLFTLWIDE